MTIEGYQEKEVGEERKAGAMNGGKDVMVKVNH